MGDAVIPNDWTNEYCQFAVCWPNSPQWLAVLRGVLTIPAQGRFWNEQTGIITEAQDIIEETFAFNFQHRGVIMTTCNDETNNALLAIASAIALSSGGGASAQANCNCFGDNISITTYVTLPDGTLWPVPGTEPIATVTPGEFPEGYEDEAEYLVDKCAKANKIIDDFISSLKNMSLINWAAGGIGIGVLLGAIVGIITVPEVAIPVLLFALVANGAITAGLTALANEIEANRLEWVCWLYTGENYEVIIGLVADGLDAIIALIGVSSVIGVALKTIALTLLNSDTVNYLFTAKAKELYSGGDCDACTECLGQTYIEGEITGDDIALNVRTVTVVGELATIPDPDIEARAAFYFNGEIGEFDCCMEVLSVEVVAGAWTAYSDSAQSDYWGFKQNCGGSAVRVLDQAEFTTDCKEIIVLYSTTACTWEVSYREC